MHGPMNIKKRLNIKLVSFQYPILNSRNLRIGEKKQAQSA